MSTEKQQNLNEFKKIHGLASAIGREMGVSVQYANMIINGKRASKTEKAARVLQRFNEINKVLNS